MIWIPLCEGFLDWSLLIADWSIPPLYSSEYSTVSMSKCRSVISISFYLYWHHKKYSDTLYRLLTANKKNLPYQSPPDFSPFLLGPLFSALKPLRTFIFIYHFSIIFLDCILKTNNVMHWRIQRSIGQSLNIIYWLSQKCYTLFNSVQNG